MSTVIEVKNLSKRYRIGLKQQKDETFAGQILSTLKAPVENFRRLRDLSRFKEEDESVFWALRDINFEVKEGEVLGIIGHNGAGKSTLLKILSRITEPTSGEIHIKGRIAALLEVGTGFHQDLTGRENVYMNGTILGMTKREIDAKFDEIVDFSGVEKFIDTPVKFYSSGMKVRLGFAVAANLEPEILIIDEVLAVGDADFQRKCLGKMQDVAKNEGRTILFVSHNIAAIKRLCTKCLLINQGVLQLMGDIDTAASEYLKNDNFSLRKIQPKKGTQLLDIWIENVEGQKVTSLDIHGKYYLTIKIFSEEYADDLHFGITIYNEEQIGILSAITSDNISRIPTGISTIQLELPISLFNQGRYRIEGSLASIGKLHEQLENYLVFECARDNRFDIKGNKPKGLLRINLPWELLDNTKSN